MYPRNDLDYSSRFLHMMFSVPAEEYVPDPIIANALNTLFILHADHEQNCSASTVRIVGSGHANLFSSVAAGIHALVRPAARWRQLGRRRDVGEDGRRAR